MCGIHWYREQLEKADQDRKQLIELLTMLQERYQIPQHPGSNGDSEDIPPTIWELYREVQDRLNAP